MSEGYSKIERGPPKDLPELHPSHEHLPPICLNTQWGVGFTIHTFTFSHIYGGPLPYKE